MRTMPFIRYCVGDLGGLSPDPCPCGRGLPLLKNLHGRRVDMLVNPEGELHHPFSLMVILEDIQAVERFRIVQTAVDHIRVDVNWDTGADAATKHRATTQIERGFAERMGPRVKVEVVDAP